MKKLIPTLTLVATGALLVSGCSSLGSTFASADFNQYSGPNESFRGEGGKNQ